MGHYDKTASNSWNSALYSSPFLDTDTMDSHSVTSFWAYILHSCSHRSCQSSSCLPVCLFLYLILPMVPKDRCYYLRSLSQETEVKTDPSSHKTPCESNVCMLPIASEALVFFFSLKFPECRWNQYIMPGSRPFVARHSQQHAQNLFEVSCFNL